MFTPLHPVIHSTLATSKLHAQSILGSLAAWLGVITANQVQLEYWLRFGATVGALAASAFTIWGVLRRDNRESATSTTTTTTSTTTSK